MKSESTDAARNDVASNPDAPRWLPAMAVATGVAFAMLGGQGVASAAPDGDADAGRTAVSRPPTSNTATDRSTRSAAADEEPSQPASGTRLGIRPHFDAHRSSDADADRGEDGTETDVNVDVDDPDIDVDDVEVATDVEVDTNVEVDTDVEIGDDAPADISDDPGADTAPTTDSDARPRSDRDEPTALVGRSTRSDEGDSDAVESAATETRRVSVSETPADTSADVPGSRSALAATVTAPAALAVTDPPPVTYKSVVADIMTWIGLGRWATDLPGPGLPMPRLLASAWLLVRESQYKWNNQRPAADPTASTELTLDGAVVGDLNATDYEGDPLTYSVTGAPTHGTVVVDEQGHFTYVPDVPAGSAVVDQFTITIDDTVGNPPHYYGLLGLAGILEAPTVTVNVAVTSVGDVSIAPPPRPLEAAMLAAQAYLYGYPLLETERLQAEAPATNTLIALTSYIDPDQHLVVAPNVDTLYTLAYLDLSEGPVVLSHPDMQDRYFVFQLMDPYTNVVGYFGSRTTGSEAASYAIVWEDGPQGEVPPDAEVIVVPYADIWLLGRTLAGDEADQQEAVALMRQYSITPPGGPQTYPIEDFDTTTSAPLPTGIEALDAISAAMVASPPPDSDADKLAELVRIGVGPGLEVSDANLSPASEWAAQAAVRTVSALLGPLVSLAQYSMAARNDGWASPDPAIGDYGTDYLLRAGVAKIGLGANTPEEAYYATAFLDENLRRLNGRHSYQLHFEPGQEPPADAFWSITVYDSEGFLVPNEQEIYAVSSTGSGNLVYQEDGSIDIVFSQEDPQDPSVNWIPVPDGAFRVYLRVYDPQEEVLDGSWVVPGIERL